MLKVVCVLRNQVDASVIKAALDKTGIKNVIRTFIDTAYDGIFVPQRGYGEVLVEENDAAVAKEVIADVTSRSEE